MTIYPTAKPPVGRSCCLIKLQVRNRCQLQNARFYEVPRRPGMLLLLQHPRRSHVAPIFVLLLQKTARSNLVF
jgi:hypothetical protein